MGPFFLNRREKGVRRGRLGWRVGEAKADGERSGGDVPSSFKTLWEGEDLSTHIF